MSRIAYFITHPNVAISDDVPVTQWPLSEPGRARMIECLKQPWIAEVTSIYSSTEQKSVDAAQILAKHLSLPFVQVVELGENDRSSTGFLPPKEFELVANEFFEKPGVSVRAGNAPSMLRSASSRPLSGCLATIITRVQLPSFRTVRWERSSIVRSQASGSIASGISRPPVAATTFAFRWPREARTTVGSP